MSDSNITYSNKLQQSKLEQGEFLLNGFQRLFDTHSELNEINQKFGSDQKLRILCYQISEYPTLIEKFITLANKSPSFLERSLLCSWLSFLIADQLHLSVVTTKDLFVAGLSQDLSENLGSNGYSEASVSFIDLIPRLSDQVKIIVSEHLECFDGTGGPVGKTESQLSTTSQVLIVSNEIADLLQLNRQLHKQSSSNNTYCFSNILPILKLNAAVYFRDIYRVAANLITPDPKALPASEGALTGSRLTQYPLSISSIIDTQKSLSLRWPYVVKATAELTTLHEIPAVASLRSIARRAWMMVTTAGVLSDELSQWISQLKMKESRAEVIELEILLEELGRIFTRFQRLLETLLQNDQLEMNESKRSTLLDASDALKDVDESFDIEEFTLLNMCD
jgi:hypothetical protein